MKRLFDYLKYSGLWITLVVNPFHWGISFSNQSQEWPNDYLHSFNIRVLFISIKVVIDDGSW